MKKFNFRLEPVLRLRLQQEDQKKRAVGVLQSEINVQQQAALDMAEDIRSQGSELKHQFESGTIDVNWIASYQGYVSALQRSINEKIANVGEIQKRLIDARTQLADAARERRIIEKLKERQVKRHTDEVNRLENLENDEIGNNLYNRMVRTAGQVEY
jgi:flagellar FliJ protein